LQAYTEELAALNKATADFAAGLVEHQVNAAVKPNLKSMGQLIVARKKIKEALNVLYSI